MGVFGKLFGDGSKKKKAAAAVSASKGRKMRFKDTGIKDPRAYAAAYAAKHGGKAAKAAAGGMVGRVRKAMEGGGVSRDTQDASAFLSSVASKMPGKAPSTKQLAKFFVKAWDSGGAAKYEEVQAPGQLISKIRSLA